MIFDRDGNTTIILQEKASLATFLKNLKQAYPKLKNDHLGAFQYTPGEW